MDHSGSGPEVRLPIQRVTDPFLRFVELENGGAIVLLAMTVLALGWANSPWASAYEHLWHTPVGFELGDHAIRMSLAHWVNDGLMAIFFFAVGLEIKREVVRGELSTLSRAMLPIVAALGGMVIPALLYMAVAGDGAAARGWGIPMATDIAFAVAALAILGKRVPPVMKILLLALAVADDLGAVLVIALVYTESLNLAALGGAAALLAFTFGMNRAGVKSFLPYWVVGALAWLAVHESGIHATIAGVALGLLTPATVHAGARQTFVARARHLADELFDGDGPEVDPAGHRRHHAYRQMHQVYVQTQAPLDYLHNQLDRFVVFVIMPIFALANAGVAIDPSVLGDPEVGMVTLAVAVGLLVGKPLGVTVFSVLAVRLGIAALPRGVGWPAIVGVGMLAGVGFTMSLFVTLLAFSDAALISGAKVGILIASILAAAAGTTVLRFALPAIPADKGAGERAGDPERELVNPAA